MVSTISELGSGEDELSVFAKELSPGKHTLTLTVGIARRGVSLEAIAVSAHMVEIVAAPAVQANRPVRLETL